MFHPLIEYLLQLIHPILAQRFTSLDENTLDSYANVVLKKSTAPEMIAQRPREFHSAISMFFPASMIENGNVLCAADMYHAALFRILYMLAGNESLLIRRK